MKSSPFYAEQESVIGGETPVYFKETGVRTNSQRLNDNNIIDKFFVTCVILEKKQFHQNYC